MWTYDDRARFWIILAVTFALSCLFVVLGARGVLASDAPPGCPKTKFCGCAMSLKKFGRIVVKPNLKLARSWNIFPADVPRAGNVAVRRGHVFELLYQIKGDLWMVWDPNSGQHRTRTHPRRLVGHRIVNPSAARLAALEVGR